jgi:CDP-glycerol glycerophosphotransferase (TagB/SpsB family)
LPIAGPIITGLLERGATVVLRPHPYTERHRGSAALLRRAEQALARDAARSGRPHRFGRAASEPSLFGCMNLADAMICDVSAVASDFLYTGKPFAITDMVGAGDGFAATFPVARAAYVIHRDAGNLGEVLADLLAHDPLREARRKLRAYYLGDFRPDRYAETFLAEVRRVL